MFSWTDPWFSMAMDLGHSHNHGATDSVEPYSFSTMRQTSHVILISPGHNIPCRVSDVPSHTTPPTSSELQHVVYKHDIGPLSSPTPTISVAAPVTPDKGDWSDDHSIHSRSHFIQMTWTRPWTSIQALDWFFSASQHEGMMFPYVGGK